MVIKPSPNHIFWLIRATALGKDTKASKVRTRHNSFEESQSICCFPVVHVELYLFDIAGLNSTLNYDHAVPQTLVQLCVMEDRCSPTVNLRCSCRLKSVFILLHLYSHR